MTYENVLEHVDLHGRTFVCSGRKRAGFSAGRR
jgi:hypothetical protein